MSRLIITMLIAMTIFTLGSGIGVAAPTTSVANFSANTTEGYAPLSVQFNDSSENATSVSWDFNGDGLSDSTERNPVHEYADPGNYTVNLTVTNENGTNSTFSTITVLEKPIPAIHWKFSPQEPVSGDILNIDGSASPGEKVNVFATFEKTVPVSGGKFEYNLKDVKIPEGFNNSFTVEANGAKNLNVRVKMVLWVTKSSKASGDTATVSQSNVPPGTYKIKIDGDAGEGVSEVNLKITAFEKIKADSNGNFSYSYDTTAVPTGDFEVNVGGTTEEITIRPEEPSLVLPVANFSSDVTEGYAPLTVQFTDLSENATSVSWDFGDKKNSTERNPIHKFTTQGTYTVNLTAINENSTDSKSAIINVTKKPIHWAFSPQEPVSGDILNIDGSASPGEKVNVFATFEKTVPVSGGKFEYNLKDVKIPEGFNNSFTVEANGARNLNVRVKMVLWVTKSSEASGDTSTVSQSNVPPGTYKIKIDGDAGEGVSEVNLKITAFEKIKADSNGNFSYSYDTTAVPTGDFEVNVGGTTEEITIRPEEPSLVLPVANFSSDVTEGYAPLTVQFTDLSENATSVNWDFGDKKNSTERNPIHKFTTQGTYTVNLTAINENSTDSKSAIINVTKKPIHWAFSPQEPVSGDILNINGNSSPEEKVNVFATFEKTVPVSGGKFEYNLKDVEIPEGFNNSFTVEANGARNLNVRVKMVLWVTKSSEASGDTSTVSQSNVPPGTYKIKIDGDAGEGVSEVNLKITAFEKIKADSNGNFSYSYDTTAVPTGDFEVNVGGITEEITIRPEEPSLVLPVANFSSDVTEGYSPLTVQFTDLSENATSVSWDFGDKKNSTERNPIHKFTTQGTYTVNLTAINENSTDSKSAIINVTKKPIHWAFSPQEPVSGDILNINGNSSPEEKVDVFATFEKTVPVSGGKFEYNLKDVEIPEGFNNIFTVEANGAKNLNVRVKMVLWVTKSSKASGDTATVSQSNVPPGTYKIKIDGDAGEGVSEINLKITAFEKIKADSNGNFSYSYNTTAVPPGNFEVKVGDITKEITLRPEGVEEPSLVLPVANFSSDITEGYAPLTVQFTDLSENTTSVRWDFGDKKTSTERNPVYKFTNQGTYTVNLTAINENGTDSKSATIEVIKKPIPDHTKLPTDPNHDGRYEDVNGNGRMDFNDVVVFYGNMNWIKENVPVALFDYNNNGRIDFNDVVKLYAKI